MLKRRVRFAPVDLLVAVFAGALTLTGLLAWDAISDHRAVAVTAAVSVAPFVVARLRARDPKPGTPVALLGDFWVIAGVVLVFDNLGPFIRAVNPVDRDAALIAFDRALFGTDPTRWLERVATPLLSDVLTVCYALYYFHPIVLGILLLRDDGRRRAGGSATPPELPRFTFAIVFAFFLSYAGYFAVPAIGPRFTIAHDAPLPRGTVSAAIDRTLDHLEKNKRDCFPSGHTMITVGVLLEAWRRSRRTFLAFLPFAAGLVACAVYGRYHYVADVLAGLALAWPSMALGRILAVRLGRRLGTEPDPALTAATGPAG